MTGQSRTFRVFVSSTFADMAGERNVLQEKTFPRLREYCREKGASFQAIDLRWGVSSEASLDQQTMNICLGEIRRCQEITPRPNFVVLLGQRYGWMPPPPQVRADVFEQILRTIEDDDTRELLGRWYRRDENAVTAEYVLLPRDPDPDDPKAEQERWRLIEERLQQALSRGAQAIGLTGDELLPFCASATHQEIAAGALQVEDPGDKVLCVFREIEGFPTDAEGRPANGAEDFVYADQKEIEALKEQLRGVVPDENIVESVPAAQWSVEDQQPTEDHLDALAEEVFQRLRAQIDRELGSPTVQEEREDYRIQPDEFLDAEGRAHHAVAEGHLTHFVGRDDVLDRVATYLDDPGGRPLVICGEGGTGKSALLSKVIEQAQAAPPGAQLVYRFIGATPESSTSRSLLLGLSRELCRRRGEDETAVPEDENKLAEYFREQLAATDAPPLIVVLDALDQLPEKDPGRNLAWLPFRELPAQVRMVMTTRPGKIEKSLRKSRQAVVEPLGGMSREEGEKLLDLWLKDSGRTLQPDPEHPGSASSPPDQRREVLEKFAASECRPLFLRLAFEEARLWRSWQEPETLTVGVEGTIRDNLFARLSREQHHGEVLVSHALGYLAASRYGLAEDELHAVLSRDAEVYASFLEKSHHLPPDLVTCARRFREGMMGHPVSDREAIDWLEEIRKDRDRLRETLAEFRGAKGPRLPAVLLARLRADLDPYLTTRASKGVLLLDFYHRELGDVSRAKFVAGHGESRHGGLAGYFLSAADPEGDRRWKGERRGLSELPYHLTCAEDWDQLIGDEENPGVLCDLLFIEAKCAAGLGYELSEDYSRAEEGLPELREGQEKDRAARERCQRYALDLADYGAGRRVELPKPPPACELSLGLAPDRAETATTAPEQPTRANRLRRFGGFYIGNSHLICRHPDRTLPLAGNFGDSGTISKQGRAFLCQTRSLWLRRHAGVAIPPLHPACRAVLEGHTSLVGAVAVSADFTRAVSGSRDKTLRVWDLERGACGAVLEGHTDWVWAVAASADFTRAISGSGDKTLRVWDLERGTCRAVLQGHTESVAAVAASADFSRALSGSEDHTLRVWDLESGACRAVLQGHTESVVAVAASADFSRAVSGSWDNTLRVWDLERGTCRAVLEGHTSWVRAVAASADFTWAVSSGSWDQTLRVWNLERGTCQAVLEGHTDWVGAVAASADFTRAVSGSEDHTLRVWDLERGACWAVMEGHTNWVRAVAVSADFTRALSGSGDKALRVWNLERGTCRAILEGHTDWVRVVAASADFTRIVSGSWDKTLRIWDLERGVCLAVLEGHTSEVRVASISADFSRAISGSGDKTLRVWDLERGACRAVLEGHTSLVGAVAVSADFTRALSGSEDHTLRVWDLERGACQAVLEGHTSLVGAVAASADFTRALSGSEDHTLRVWNLERGTCRAVLEGHTWGVCALAVSADFSRAVSGSGDNTLRVWDLERGVCLASYYAGSPVRSMIADFSRGRFVCGCEDGQVHFLTLLRGNEIVRMDPPAGENPVASS